MTRPTGPRGLPTPASSEAPEGQTQRLPQMLVEPSSGLVRSALAACHDDGVAPTQPTLSRPRLVVMEEHPIGLVDALARLGYLVRLAQTGVEAMSMCAEHVPIAVVVGPGDAERRRALTTGLRLRFGAVVVVYVLPEGDAGARPEGVHAILPWPLPPSAEVMRAIPFNVAPPSSSPIVTRVVPPTAALRARSDSEQPELSADESEEGSFAPLPMPPSTRPPVQSASLPPETTRSPARARSMSVDELATLQVARAELGATREGVLTDATMPGAAPIIEESPDNNGIAGLLRGAAPLLWRLDEAARFLDEVATLRGGATGHADTVRAVARLLARLQERLAAGPKVDSADDEKPVNR